MRRARMKPGVRPIIIDCSFVPDYPVYWSVPESASAAVALLVQDGQIEYEPAMARRGDDGQFAVQTALQPVAAATKPFQRKAPK